jgi:hypothetical protein
MDDQPSQLSIHLVRYDVRGWNAARSLAPLAGILLLAARRFPNRWVVVPALASLALSLALFVRARKSFGWRSLELGRHALSLAGTELELSRQDVRQWTLVGSTARLYGSRFSYKLRLLAEDHEALATALKRVLGSATPLKRRGSVRARIIAGSVCMAGLLSLAAAISLNLAQLLFVAVPAIILGFAAYMALSQRIAVS